MREAGLQPGWKNTQTCTFRGGKTNPSNARAAVLIQTIGETKAHQNCRFTSEVMQLW